MTSPAQHDPLAVVITGREMYDVVLRLDGSVRTVLSQMTDRLEVDKDHEVRIRALESRRWPLPVMAALGAIAGVGSLVVAVFALMR